MKLLRLSVCVAVLLGIVGFVRAEEEKVAVAKLPKAIVASLKKRFPKAELLSAEKETEGKKTTYEVELRDGGFQYEVELTEEGTITGMEKIIDVKDLPKVVAEAVAAKYPKAPMKKAEEVIKVVDGKEVLSHYEVVVVVDGKKIEVEVLADGKLKPEDKKDKDGDK